MVRNQDVIFDEKLNFREHKHSKINMAFKMVRVIKRHFKYLSISSFVLLSKSLVRSHLDYCNSVWTPYRKSYLETLEKVQKRATEILPKISHFKYADRLIAYKLPTLHYRWIRGDMTETYLVNMTWSLVINKPDSCSSVMAGAPDVLPHRLQSVLNAAVQLVFSARRFGHMTPLLCDLHRLKVPEQVRFQLCVLTYRCLNSTVPHYLAEAIRPVSSRGTRQHLRSAETSTLLVPSTRRSTLGDRSFPVAATRAWNALPQYVRNAPSLSVFRRELKTVLFRSSFPDAI